MVVQNRYSGLVGDHSVLLHQHDTTSVLGLAILFEIDESYGKVSEQIFDDDLGAIFSSYLGFFNKVSEMVELDLPTSSPLWFLGLNRDISYVAKRR